MSENSNIATGGGLPTRIITYAWGEKYVDELLSLALPALLAPGNLPAVAAVVPCELVLLTEERLFPTVLANRAIARLRAFCPMRLLGLDDLITEKDKYGMALTYALHRGFSDLGPAMTEAWLIFLNADFILADGSLRNLLPYLFRGDRLIASPSYCTDSVQARANLLTHIDPVTGVLTLAPRKMANLILNDRHNTIRAKTVNRSTYHFQWMDQFYWQVDDHTLLGRQMPIAIAAMRPERFLAEPNSYWDYGLMREFCPTSSPTVLGDSDDFLMLELREPQTYRELVNPGRPDPKKIGARMVSWVTPYQREFAHFPLALHDKDLPQGVDVEQHRLDAFVAEVLSHSPPRLPSHIDHPQWSYHYARFFEKRHAYLSQRLGSLTEAAPPPLLSALDRAWWLLDGKRKIRARLRAQTEQEFEALIDQSDRQKYHSRAGLGSPGETATGPILLDGSVNQPLYADLHLAPSSDSADRTGIDRWLGNVATLERNLDAEESELQRKYKALLQDGPASATIPEIEVERGPSGTGADSGGAVRRVVRSAYYRTFGKLPRPSRLSPYWSLLQPLLQIVDPAIAAGASDGLIVGSSSDLTANLLDTMPGIRARVSLLGAQSGNFAKAFHCFLPDHKSEFDIVVCDIDAAMLVDFAKLYAAVRPLAREGGLIVGFYCHKALGVVPPDLTEIRIDNIEADAVDIKAFGSVAATRALRLYQTVHRWNSLPAPVRLAAAPLIATPFSYVASRHRQDASHAEHTSRLPCTNLTICVSVRKHLHVAGRFATVRPGS